MKILFLPTWSVARQGAGGERKPPNICSSPTEYWFFKHWPEASVDVLDTGSRSVARLEDRLLHCYPVQATRSLPKLSRYDLIISHGAQSGVVLAALRSLAGISHPPHAIIDVGCFAGGRSNPWILGPIRFALGSVSSVIYHAKAQEAFYGRCLPEISERAHFVPLGVDSEFFRPLDVPQENFILSIGYDRRSRDWGALLKAFGRLSDRTELRAVGPGERLPGRNVHSEPVVSIDKLKRLMAASRFVVLPFPELPFAFGQTTLLGAMAMGKAVVTTGSSGVADYLDDGETCLVAPVGDDSVLGRHMELLLDDERLASRLGTAARERIVDYFNEKRMANEIRDVCVGNRSVGMEGAGV